MAFVDFKKAFDCVSHAILLNKLNSQFRVQGTLLSWLTDYLTDRTQFSVVNGHDSTVLNVTYGIPQGSVLGATLFALYTNDLPSAVNCGSIFMYVDDTVYCIGDTVDNNVTSLNRALSGLNSWCLENSLTPHSAKCEAMLLMRWWENYWTGRDRVGKTYSSSGHYFRRQAFLGTPSHRCKKELCWQTESLEKEFVFEPKRPIGLVL